ncbi:MAG TPA: hypothetical protein VJN50_04240 [Actinomycetota bacterium]|nr:hypothetical protein [Actinomycetota bacterium]
MRRRPARLLILAILFPLVLSTYEAPPSTAATTRAKMIFGAYVQPRSGETLQEAILRFERMIDEKLAAVRVYFKWDSKFPSPLARWLKHTDRTMFMSVKSMRENGSIIKWADIANARRGSPIYKRIRHWARVIKRYHKTVYFTFNHEPEAPVSYQMGSARAFRRAWRKVITVFRRVGVHNARYLLIMTAYAFEASDWHAIRHWYPGNRYVHAVGADPYNWYKCRWSERWTPLGDTIEKFRRWGRHHRQEKLFLPEWGSVEDWSSPGRKQRWFDAARGLFKRDRWSQFKGILYFHADDQTHEKCNFYADTSSSALKGFRAMANDPFYRKEA